LNHGFRGWHGWDGTENGSGIPLSSYLCNPRNPWLKFCSEENPVLVKIREIRVFLIPYPGIKIGKASAPDVIFHLFAANLFA